MAISSDLSTSIFSSLKSRLHEYRLGTAKIALTSSELSVQIIFEDYFIHQTRHSQRSRIDEAL